MSETKHGAVPSMEQNSASSLPTVPPAKQCRGRSRNIARLTAALLEQREGASRRRPHHLSGEVHAVKLLIERKIWWPFARILPRRWSWGSAMWRKEQSAQPRR